jgi:hypothetical protein
LRIVTVLLLAFFAGFVSFTKTGLPINFPVFFAGLVAAFGAGFVVTSRPYVRSIAFTASIVVMTASSSALCFYAAFQPETLQSRPSLRLALHVADRQ